MNLRGMPISVVEAAVKALQEQDTTRDWAAGFVGSDAELLTALAPVVEASVAVWAEHQVLAAECDAGDGHDLDIVLDGDEPVGVACGHCGSSWAMAPGRPGAAVAAPAPAKKATKAAKAAKAAKPSRGRRIADDLRPEPVAPADVPVDADVKLCAECSQPIDMDDEALAKANGILYPEHLGKKPVCGSCMLTCRLVAGEEHDIESYDQAALAAMKFQERACRACFDRMRGEADG